MRVLVTGGTGFLGSHVIDKLLEEAGAEVYALVRDPAKLRGLERTGRLRLLEGDLLDVPPLPAGLTCVIHLAGLTKTLDSSAYYTVNREGTASLLRALEKQSADLRFVLMSSIAAAGPSEPGRSRREDDPPRPVNPYGDSKLRAEEEALKYKDRFSIVILRAAAVYGPRDEDFLEIFRWLKRGILPLVGSRPKSLSLCYVRDAARAALVAATGAVRSGEVFNIADPAACSWEGFGSASGRALGKKFVRVRMPYWTVRMVSAAAEGIGRLSGGAPALNLGKYKQMKPDFWVADVRKAREKLGFETRFSLDAGLRETFAWYISQGRL